MSYEPRVGDSVHAAGMKPGCWFRILELFLDPTDNLEKARVETPRTHKKFVFLKSRLRPTLRQKEKLTWRSS